jgi:hypothetical protein
MSFWKNLAKFALPAAAMFIPGVGPAVGAALGKVGSAAASTVANPSVWGKLASVGKNYGGVIGAAGAALGAGAQAFAQNRGTQAEFDLTKAELEQRGLMEQARLRQQTERDFNDALIAHEQEERAGQRSAWELLNRAAYVKHAPANLNILNLSRYSKPVAGPSADARAGASTLEAEMVRRLMAGHELPMPTRMDPGTLDVTSGLRIEKPGVMERIGGIAGPALSTWGLLSRLRDNAPYDPTGRS